VLKYHIQTIELSAASPAVLFTSIPQTYDDLYLVYSIRTSGNDDYWGLALNGSTSNFSLRSLFGTGSGVTSDTRSDGLVGNTANPNNYTANTFSNGALYIPNYKSNVAKSISNDAVTENNATEAKQRITAMLWNPPVQSAITQIGLNAPSGMNFAQYSSASLYGIKRDFSGQVDVASGGTISTSGGYTYHTFTSSGTFVANRSLQADVLVVAGGGGGGRGETQTGTNAGGGGGGAGGYLATSLSISPQSYSVVVGSGGAGGAASTSGSSGSNSSAISLAAIGGGGGGENSVAGGSGGSGGGGGGVGGGAGGAGTAGQGNAGGNGGSGGSASAAGGGGAGAAAANVTAGPTAGGAGLQWLNGTFYAGGGGGAGYTTSAAGGTGGGGAGGLNTSTATSGTANTGGGGGGAGIDASANSGASGSGGSGVVIIRYLTPA